MPEETGLVVVFRADGTPMTKSLTELNGQLKRFKEALQNAVDPRRIALLNRAIEATGSRIRGLQSHTARPFQDITQRSNQAGQAVLNTGRVIQDLPFAFNNFGSIANNLDPLFESFTRLREQAKATGQSVGKALLSSLKGAAGIGLAISAVTAGITIWQMYGDKIKRALGFTDDIGKGSGEALKKAREGLDKYVDGLDDVARARIRGTQEAQEELIRVQFLYQATQNHTLSLKERTKAVDELQAKYPTYFGNLSNEAILAGNAGAAYIKLRDSILAAARARSAMKELEELSSQMRVIEDQQEKALQKESDAFNQRKKLQQAEEQRRKGAAKDFRAEVNAMSGILGIERLRVDAQKEGNELEKRRQELLERSKKLIEDVNGIVQENGVDALVGPKVKAPKTPKENFEFFNKWFGFNPNGTLSAKQKDSLMDAANNFAKEFTTIFEGLNFYPAGGKTPAIDLAKRFWADFSKGIVQFKPDAFQNIDFSKDIPQSLEPFKRDLQAAFNEANKILIAGPFENVGSSLEIQKQTLFSEYRKVFESVGQQLPKTIKLNKIDVPIDLAFSLNPAEVEKQLGVAAARIESMIASLNEKMAATLREMQTNAIAAVGEALGTAIAGGDIKNVFNGLFAALGTAMQELGKALIATAVGLKAIKEAFKTLNPVVAAAAGVGLIALGAIIKSKVAGAAPFAQGGLVFGPTFGLVGEGAGTSRRNPEIIAPLDKLKGMLDDGGNIVIINKRIRGNDLLLSAERTRKTNRRGG